MNGEKTLRLERIKIYGRVAEGELLMELIDSKAVPEAYRWINKAEAKKIVDHLQEVFDL